LASADEWLARQLALTAPNCRPLQRLPSAGVSGRPGPTSDRLGFRSRCDTPRDLSFPLSGVQRVDFLPFRLGQSELERLLSTAAQAARLRPRVRQLHWGRETCVQFDARSGRPHHPAWRPSRGELDRYGREIPDHEYGTKDFERAVALKARTETIARHLTSSWSVPIRLQRRSCSASIKSTLRRCVEP
jgi:hypothetical protein